MEKRKVKVTFFDGKLRKAGTEEEFTDAEANRHALAGRIEIDKPKPKKKPAKPKLPSRTSRARAAAIIQPKAISSDKKSAGALAKPKKKPAKPRGKKK